MASLEVLKVLGTGNGRNIHIVSLTFFELFSASHYIKIRIAAPQMKHLHFKLVFRVKSIQAPRLQLIVFTPLER